MSLLDDAFRNAPDDPQDNRAPDGEYDFKCSSAEIRISKSGDKCFIWKWEVATGQHKGCEAVIITNFTKVEQAIRAGEEDRARKSLGVLKHKLGQCGILLQSLEEDLPRAATFMTSLKIRGELTTRDKFQNLKILECYNPIKTEAPAKDSYQAPPPEEEVPF
jgi:hypothetical protein